MNKLLQNDPAEKDLSRPKRLGHIDYMDDFDDPESQVYFHWWDKIYVGMHDHNHYEIFLITRGNTMHTLNGIQTSLSKGCMMLIRPEDYHTFYPSPNEKQPEISPQHINLSFTVDKMQSICSVFPGLKTFIDQRSSHQCVNLSDSQLDYFLSNAKQINLVQEERRDRKQVVAYITTEMITEALSILYKTNLNMSPQYPVWFNQLIQKLHEPEALSYSMKDIYAMSHYSPPMLLKYFKEYTGETIVSYFTKIKMKFACNLLQTTNFSILEISNRVYFDSISHFNRLFKQYTGFTPSQYKKLKNLEH